MSVERLLSVIEQKGVMKAAELEPFVSSRAQIRRYVETGILISLGAGFYAHPSFDPFAASVLAAALHFPKAVISNITALVIHGFSDERGDRVDVDIPRNASIRNQLIRAHRVAEDTMVGAVLYEFHGHRIRIYCRERALCAAYRIDPDGPLFFKALKRYVAGGGGDAQAIAGFDRALQTQVMRSLMQELADG